MTERLIEHIIEDEQRRRGIRASAAQTSRERNIFLKVNLNTFLDSCAFQKHSGCPVHQVSGIGRQGRVAAGQMNTLGNAAETQMVENGNRLKDRLQFMEAV